MNVLLNGRTGRVGTVLGPALEQAGHVLVARVGEAEAMVDFTVPAAVIPNITAAIEAGIPSVVGTTGWDTAEVDAAARAAGVPVFYAANFAIGAVLMMRFAAEASRHMDKAEIVEMHHETKLDAPSGTAKATAAGMEGDVPIHSIRLPGVVSHQEVIFGGPGQLLTIRHEGISSDAYVPGVLLALSKVHELPPGVTSGLDALL